MLLYAMIDVSLCHAYIFLTQQITQMLRLEKGHIGYGSQITHEGFTN